MKMPKSIKPALTQSKNGSRVSQGFQQMQATKPIQKPLPTVQKNSYSLRSRGMKTEKFSHLPISQKSKVNSKNEKLSIKQTKPSSKKSKNYDDEKQKVEGGISSRTRASNRISNPKKCLGILNTENEEQICQKSTNCHQEKLQHSVQETNQTQQKALPQCSICMEGIDGKIRLRTQLNSCNHVFCSECITQWAQTRAVCPNCKNGFYKIVTFQPKDPKTNVRQAIVQYAKKQLIIAELHRTLREEAKKIFTGLNTTDPQERLKVELQSVMTLRMGRINQEGQTPQLTTQANSPTSPSTPPVEQIREQL